jgi:predicted alpha/beta hydrolase
MWIQCSDGTRLACTLNAPQAEPAAAPPRYVIINSATGVQRGYYRAFADHLTALGCHVLTWDARGIGDSKTGHARHSQARMRDWGALDFEAVLKHVLELASGDWQRISVIGHSSGGHLSGLAPSMQYVKNLILVASGTCDWRLYPPMQWPRLLAAWYGLAPVVLRTLGYWPGRMGVGHDLPPGVAWDWRNWSVQRDYLFADASLDLIAYAQFSGSLLALHFHDDLDFAPPDTVRDLVKRFPSAHARIQEYNPRLQGHQSVGHFGFFQKKNADLWPLLHSHLSLAS